MLFRLKMGLKLERLPGSRLGFLSKGVTRSDLKQDGKQSSAKDKLAKCAIRWEKTSEQETTSGVGMKFIGDDLGTILFRRLNVSKQVAGVKSLMVESEQSESRSRSFQTRFAAHLAILYLTSLILV